jgi:DNA N-6-adenine-methyltransferase (Dam)
MTAGRTVIGKSVHWGTPPKYIDAVRKAFRGDIALDPCSNEWSIVGAKTEWTLPNDDGLRSQWDYPTVFVNPPYGLDKARGTRISHWIAKCANSSEKFQSEIIALIPLAANTKHWKEHIWAKATSICFLYDTRLRFLENGKDTGKGAPMACCAVYWGKYPKLFSDAFVTHGATIELRDIHLPTLAIQPKLKLVMR